MHLALRRIEPISSYTGLLRTGSSYILLFFKRLIILSLKKLSTENKKLNAKGGFVNVTFKPENGVKQKRAFQTLSY